MKKYKAKKTTWQTNYASAEQFNHARTDGQHDPNAYCIFRLLGRRRVKTFLAAAFDYNVKYFN